MKANPGQKNLKSYYKFFSWIYPIGRKLFPAGFCTLEEVGLAMINTAKIGYPKRVLEVKTLWNCPKRNNFFFKHFFLLE